MPLEEAQTLLWGFVDEANDSKFFGFFLETGKLRMAHINRYILNHLR
jgi:hypothetical protein